MASATTLSLEPLRLFAGDGKDSDLFARPARLHDVVLDDGREVFTRDDPKKSISERLMRVWQERGDYSKLTEDSIRNPVQKDKEEQADEDDRPSVENMHKLQKTMLQNLTIARGELSTALDLLSVLSAPTDPPDVDVNTIPLPQQTLTLVPTAPPPHPSTDPSTNPLAALPLASSLGALKSSANAFFRASEELIPLDEAELEAAGLSSASSTKAARPRTRDPDPWPTILRLHASSPRSLIPLGAMKGASLSGKGETRTAKEVGVFFGCQEAKEEYRRAAVARVGELLQDEAAERTGRKMVFELDSKGEKESRAAFAEELFAQLATEAQAEKSATRARFELGSGKKGDSVVLEGAGWNLRISMAVSPGTAETACSSSSRLASLASLVRLLFLQDYTSRRASTPRKTPSTSSRRILATLCAYLNYSQRAERLSGILEDVSASGREQGVQASVGYDGAKEAQGSATDVVKVLRGETELGVLVTLRIGTAHVIHIAHSYPLPSSPAPSQAPPILPSAQPTLSLRLPGRAPLQVPGLRHLEGLVREELGRVISLDRERTTEKSADGAKEVGEAKASNA
ncbi:mediator complex, subunit Med17 [Rhodotorula toruloides]|uniref:Mediator of RNA polymerase II transcription subunit 17 n=1 Tax=Rhodotorula toruloides TaxID=5286 RepID=A0A511KH14_RHOTO|nr:mediator complex, subunit Med17 [Rhodotorula toruloides]